MSGEKQRREVPTIVYEPHHESYRPEPLAPGFSQEGEQGSEPAPEGSLGSLGLVSSTTLSTTGPQPCQGVMGLKSVCASIKTPGLG